MTRSRKRIWSLGERGRQAQKMAVLKAESRGEDDLKAGPLARSGEVGTKQALVWIAAPKATCLGGLGKRRS